MLSVGDARQARAQKKEAIIEGLVKEAEREIDKVISDPEKYHGGQFSMTYRDLFVNHINWWDFDNEYVKEAVARLQEGYQRKWWLVAVFPPSGESGGGLTFAEPIEESE